MMKYVIVPVSHVTWPNGALYTTFSWVFYVTCVTLISCHAFTLYHAKTKMHSPFSSKMITYYLLYNVLSLISVMAFTIFVYPKPGYPVDFWLLFWMTIVILAEAGNLMMINLAMWKFGFHYYNCGVKLPFYLEGTPPPKELNSRNKCIEKTFTILNVIFPISFGAVSFI